MKQIRKGVFETNSSSTHSVTIQGEGYKELHNYGILEAWFVFPKPDGEILHTKEDKIGFIMSCIAHKVLEPYNIGWWEKSSVLENRENLQRTLCYSYPVEWVYELVNERTSFPLFMWWDVDKNNQDYDYSNFFKNYFMNGENELIFKIGEAFENKKTFKNLVDNIVFDNNCKIVCEYMGW